MLRLSCRVIAYVLMAAYFTHASYETAKSAAKEGIARDSHIRGKLDELVQRLMLASRGENATKESLDKRALEGLEQLKKAAGGKPAALIPEIVFYQADVKDERALWIADVVLRDLVKTLNSDEVIAAVAPYLFAENEEARYGFHLLMDQACAGAPAVDFGPIFALMRVQRGTVADNLVKYMYERSPGEAMLGYMRFHLTSRPRPGWSDEERALLLAEREISTMVWKQQYNLVAPGEVGPGAAASLKELSENKNWWVRLYVAEIMKQHPGFRNAAIVESFKKDENKLVREAVAFGTKDGENGATGKKPGDTKKSPGKSRKE